MPNEYDPIVNNWYTHKDKGQLFTIVDVGEDSIDIQYFDGDLEEISFSTWRNMDIELGEEPENWTGAMDIAEADDLGTEVTDTRPDDWSEPLREHHQGGKAPGPAYPADDWAEGALEEEPVEKEI